ncbi:GNAT family N-acetyltransferase [Kocuria rosea]|uniref:GNAT family N-acetyltransferase n=1 Tax=Kocuria rosea TaxID=1275 RepID=UPI00203C5500|nr:GNAT family N-acetyltransferase [Kocuria rosea]MCM3687915.1 GNAT family N-acetyltransferase [Kocuria rosea]
MGGPGNLVIRPWRDGDDLRLLEVWPDPETATAAQFRATLGPDGDAPWSRTLVAEDSGVPIAAGTVRESALHPLRLWAWVEVAPDRRGEGLGRALLERLRAEAAAAPSGVRALRTKVAPGSAGERFARAAGLGPVQLSRVVRVEPGALPLRPLREHADGTPAQAVQDLATGSVELTRVLWEFYRAVHGWDDPADLPVGRVNQLFLSDAAHAFGAVVLRNGVAPGERGRISAFAVSYRPLELDAAPGAGPAEAPADAPANVLLGWAPGDSAAGPAVEQLLALLVHDHPVQFQVDGSMEPLTAVADNLLAAGVASVVETTVVLAEPAGS